MPNLNKVEIAIILDRSGSMQGIRDDMEQGFRAFLEEQRKLPGELVVSLYQFDDKFDVMYEEIPVQDVKGLNLHPRGFTALYDAVGKATGLMGERLAAKAEADRPGGVIVMVITDGQENASKEYNKEKVQAIVKHQSEVYKWQFMYLGSDLSTAQDAAAINMRSAGYLASPKGVRGLTARMSGGVAQYRTSTSRGHSATLDIPDDPSGNTN